MTRGFELTERHPLAPRNARTRLVLARMARASKRSPKLAQRMADRYASRCIASAFRVMILASHREMMRFARVGRE